MPEDTSYTPEEVAKLLKISRFTVYEMIKRGELLCYRIGRKMRIEASDLENYKRKARGLENNDLQHTDQCMTSAVKLDTDNRLVVCGQEMILDILTKHLERQLPKSSFLRSYTCSMDGLLALYHGSANVAATHLLDGETGEYNIPYVRALLPGQRFILVNLVYRYMGFLVTHQNPRNITDWSDLARADVKFVNREKGSGARVLLDEKIRCLNIDQRLIQGYNQEETSHLAIASCISRGAADVGLGIEKVAMQVPNLAFIPLQKERYDLVMRKEDLDKPQFKVLLSILRSSSFRNEIAGMGGYDVSRMGETITDF